MDREELYQQCFNLLPETIELLETKRELTRELKRKRRRLVTSFEYHQFLLRMLTISGKALERATCVYFESLGFEAEWVGGNSDFCDVYVHLEDRVIVIECKGKSRSSLKDHEITKLNSDKKRYLRNNLLGNDKKLHFLIVSNVEYSLPNPKDLPLSVNSLDELIEDGNSVVETLELLKVYNDLKTKALSERTFIESLCKPGLVKF